MLKRRLFKIIIDDNVDTIVAIYTFNTLKTFFTITTLLLAIIQFILYLTKINTHAIDLIMNLAIVFSTILILIMNIFYSKYRKLFIKQLDTGNDNQIEEKPVIKKDKYRCP